MHLQATFQLVIEVWDDDSPHDDPDLITTFTITEATTEYKTLSEQHYDESIYLIYSLELVGCTRHFYGNTCSTYCQPREGHYTCSSDGEKLCTESYMDPTTNCTSTSSTPWPQDICSRYRPCANGGKCAPHGDLGNYNCTCSPGYIGMNCTIQEMDDHVRCPYSPSARYCCTLSILGKSIGM